MAKIDPQQERMRLAEFYSQQMDGELEKVASQGLRTHRSCARGVAFVEQAPVAPVPVAQPGDPMPEAPKVEALPGGELGFQEMVTIRQFRDLPEALLGSVGGSSKWEYVHIISGRNEWKPAYLFCSGLGAVEAAAAPMTI